MALRNFGRLCEKSTSLFLCDMQEKFRPNIGMPCSCCVSLSYFSLDVIPINQIHLT